ncbi:MAG TPA: calcium/sodium antiporter [Porticoccaceae bacterium]|jgi:cation:H+ antiporter|nr:calcium/sodium antiporter [Porticoccaceae bacterium]
MSLIFLSSLSLLGGLLGLVWAADKFVGGSIGLARNFGVSSLMIGLTVVSIGTSAPEIIVSVNAALQNAGGLAVGNAIGSNIANIGLVLGITALIAAIPVRKSLLQQEIPLLLLITAFAGLCLYDGQLQRGESIALGLLVIPLLLILGKFKKNTLGVDEHGIEETHASGSLKQSSFWLIIGLIALLSSAKLTVWGATTIASHFGISDLIIGLTVVAIGTSLPELAASVVSAVRGHHDIAVGNIIGSNLFNILLVMTTAGAISPIVLTGEVFSRDYIAMAAMTVLMVAIIAVSLRRGSGTGDGTKISRVFGLLLLIAYCLYYTVLWPSLVSN